MRTNIFTGLLVASLTGVFQSTSGLAVLPRSEINANNDITCTGNNCARSVEVRAGGLRPPPKTPEVVPPVHPDPVTPVNPADPVANPADPPPRLGDPDAPGSPQRNPNDPPPRLGEPVPKPNPDVTPGTISTERASLGTEDDFIRMGLHPGTPQREAFDKFNKFYEENAAMKTDQPWLFYTKTSQRRAAVVHPFRDGYAAGKYRLPGEPADSKMLHNFIDDFDFEGIKKQLGPGPPPNEELWYDGVISFAAARTAATRGGQARVLIPKDIAIDPKGKWWTNFELYELTGPKSNLNELWRYDVDNFDAPPVLAWKKGDPPLGIPAQFSEKMVKH